MDNLKKLDFQSLKFKPNDYVITNGGLKMQNVSENNIEIRFKELKIIIKS